MTFELQPLGWALHSVHVALELLPLGWTLQRTRGAWVLPLGWGQVVLGSWLLT